MNHLSEATLQAFLDGKLGEEHAAVQQHVQECEACRQQLATYRALYRQLAVEIAPALPADFSTRVLERLQPQKQAERDWLGWLVFAFSILLSLGTAVYFFQWQSLVASTTSLFVPLLTFGRELVHAWHTIQLPWPDMFQGLPVAMAALLAMGILDWLVSQNKLKWNRF